MRSRFVKILQKCDKAKVEHWIKKILKDAPDGEGGSRKKVKEGKKPILQLSQQSLHLWRKADNNLLYSRKKNNVLYSCYTRILAVDFYWKFSKNFYPEHWLENFFLLCIWFVLFIFLKNILVHFVTADGLTKLLIQTSSKVKTKSCSLSNSEFHCLLGRLFSRFQEVWRVKRQT